MEWKYTRETIHLCTTFILHIHWVLRTLTYRWVCNISRDLTTFCSTLYVKYSQDIFLVCTNTTFFSFLPIYFWTPKRFCIGHKWLSFFLFLFFLFESIVFFFSSVCCFSDWLNLLLSFHFVIPVIRHKEVSSTRKTLLGG